LVERVVWDHEVAGSNPVTPTMSNIEMRLIFLMTCAVIFGAAIFLHAQEAADVDLAAKRKSPSPESARAQPEKLPELSQLDEVFKQTSMGKAADAQRLRVEWRQLQNKVVNDPDLIATKHAAEAARTDFEKRELLRAYYKSYYARIRRLAMSAELKQYVNAMEATHLGLTAQSRVRPSPTAAPVQTN
jgi:cell division septation protein DedD